MHYQDDQFHPAHDDGYDYPDDGSMDNDAHTYVSHATSIDPAYEKARMKQRDILAAFNNTDKGFRQLTRKQGGKKIKIDVYMTTHTPGSHIRDAVTGTRLHGFLVGSKNEDKFFKVKIATGELGRDSGNLYFETPKQCEKHLRMILSDKTKNAWYEKYADYEAATREKN